MKKYILTDEIRRDDIRTLHRIKAIRSFGDVKEGDLGGFIEKEENLSHEWNCWVFDNAEVSGDARVSDNARVYGNARLLGYAEAFGNAELYGNAKAFGDARVYGNAWVFGDAELHGNAWVFGDARVYGNAWVFGNSWVFGNAELCGDIFVLADALIKESRDYATVSGFGSKCRTTTFYRTKNGGISVSCGCFSGTIQEFREQVVKTHHGTKYEKEYLLIADLMEGHFKGWK